MERVVPHNVNSITKWNNFPLNSATAPFMTQIPAVNAVELLISKQLVA